MSSPQELNFDECSIVDPADQGPQGLLDCLADLKLMLKEVEVDSKKAKALRHCQEEIERRCKRFTYFIVANFVYIHLYF